MTLASVFSQLRGSTKFVKKKLIFIFLLFICATLTLELVAQSDFEHEVCLTQVTFSEDTDTNIKEFIPVVKDKGGFFVPHFKQQSCDGGGRKTKNPVAYVSGGYVNLEARFTTNCIESILIRGIVNAVSKNGFVSEMEFPCKSVSSEGNGSNNSYVYSGKSDKIFESSTIKFFENFDIEWQWSHIDDSVQKPCSAANWTTIGTSSNPMHVTLKKFDPTTTQTAPTFFHTLLKFTSSAADCETTDEGAINKIWEKINDLEIQTADSGKNLTYYKQWLNQCLGTVELLRSEDGQCGAFKNFMLDAIKVQGIRHSTENKESVIVFIGANSIDADEFLINNWDLNTSQFSNLGIEQGVSDEFQYLGIPHQTSSFFGNSYREEWTKNNTYNWLYSDFNSLSGLDGQGINPYPRKHFDKNHQFTNINGVFMDPSYGIEYASIQSFEANALVGYMCNRELILNEFDYDFNQDGIPDDLNDDGVTETDAEVIVLFLTTSKNLVPLLSNQ